MNEQQKAQQYSSLLYELDRLGNEIASIKGEDINLNETQLKRINSLTIKQNQVMGKLQELMR